MAKKDRVRANTAAGMNEQIDRETEKRVLRLVGSSATGLSRRIGELDTEWDMER